MREEKKLFKLSLQFFGEGEDDFLDDVDTDDPDDADGDFDDDFFDGDEIDLYGDNGLDGGADDDTDADFEADDDADGDDDAQDANDDAQGANDDAQGANDDAQGANDVAQGANDVAQGANDDLISELRALGYVGNDLAALTADMKAKREARAAQDAKDRRAADKADGKSHIRSGKPGRSASGDGTGGVSERRVTSFAESAGVSKERARQMLAKHARLIEGK